MGLKHFTDSRVAMAVAATAAVCSPKTRAMLRRGAVYGLAAALRAGDALSTFGRGVARGAQQAAAAPPGAMKTPAKASAKRARKRRSSRKNAPVKGRAESGQRTPNE